MKLLVIDGNSIVNRAFYGIKVLTTKDGKFTNAIYGFLNILFSLKEQIEPDAAAICFDRKEPTFRHKIYDKYKAGRRGTPEELASQLPVLKELLSSLGYKLLESAGWEADDLMGTLSYNCPKDSHCYIATGDRDALQLVNKNCTVLLTTGKGNHTTYDVKKVIEDKGVSPELLTEVKALMGDSSDNIPGVKGIGEKTATELIKNYGSIDYIYENIDDLKIANNVKIKLKSDKENAFLSRTLGIIAKDAPIETDYKEYIPKEIDAGRTKEILESLEMNKFIEKLSLGNVKTPAAESKNETEIEFRELPFSKIEKSVNESSELYFIYDEEFSNAYLNFDKVVCKVAFNSIIPFLGDESIKKYTENCKALYLYGIKNNVEIKNIAFDATLAGYLLNSNLKDYSVENLSGVYGIAREIENPDTNIKKIAVFRSLSKKMEDDIIKNDLGELLYNVEIPLSETLSDMENAGFKADRDSIASYGEVLGDRIKNIESEIYSLTGEEFNINSPKQLGEVLFEKLGLPVKKKTKRGYSTNAETLEKLNGLHPVIPLILEYRTLEKLKSTYCDAMLESISPDGRIHSTFRQTETRTGRLSSTEPNLQNIPVRQDIGKEIRKFFIAEEGNVLIDADYSQIELRVLASISGDENMINAFKDNVDIHLVTASQVFNMPLSMVTPLMRTRAKAVNFGIVYGIGAYSLAKDIDVPVYEAKNYIDSYLKHYDGVRRYMEDIVESAKEKGYVSTLLGRRRYLPELKSGSARERSFGERVARNMPIQGTAADIIKIAMVKVFNRLKSENMKSKLIMQVHDELILESPSDEKEKALEILKEEMENASNLKVKTSVEINAGKSWYDAK